jgi:hypothetical protein
VIDVDDNKDQVQQSPIVQASGSHVQNQASTSSQVQQDQQCIVHHLQLMTNINIQAIKSKCFNQLTLQETIHWIPSLVTYKGEFKLDQD